MVDKMKGGVKNQAEAQQLQEEWMAARAQAICALAETQRGRVGKVQSAKMKDTDKQKLTTTTNQPPPPQHNTH